MDKTTTPVVDRASFRDPATTIAITGTLPGEASGTLLYVYLNSKRAGTATSHGPQGYWSMAISDLSFGGGAARLHDGNRFYVQAQAVGKEISDPTSIYTIGGIEQPGAPYALDETTQQPRDVFERDALVCGDVPLQFLWDSGQNMLVQTPYYADLSRGIAEGVTVSVYLNGAFLAQVQSDRNGHWALDLLSPEVADHPILPLSKNQTLAARATRVAVADDGTKTEVLHASAESMKTIVRSNFFERRLFDYLPSVHRTDDVSGDLRIFTKILALSFDEMKTWIDRLSDVFAIDRCDPKYFGPLATLLGYPLNRLDSIESQRFQLKNAVEFWKRKGVKTIFHVIFHLLDYDLTVVELWTEDYKTFFPGPMKGDLTGTVYSGEPPDGAPELVENGGTWYRSPYFGLEVQPPVVEVSSSGYSQDAGTYDIDAVNCPFETAGGAASLSLADLKYLIERVDRFRPAHTVMDYLKFILVLLECGPIPRDPASYEYRWLPKEPGWFIAYCPPEDPTYFCDGLRSTRPDGRGTVTLGVDRSGTGTHGSTSPLINMYRFPRPIYCDPYEDVQLNAIPNEEETYYAFMNRSGYGVGLYPVGEPIGTPDRTDWPSCNPASEIYPKRDGARYNGYIERLVMLAETYVGG